MTLDDIIETCDKVDEAVLVRTGSFPLNKYNCPVELMRLEGTIFIFVDSIPIAFIGGEAQRS